MSIDLWFDGLLKGYKGRTSQLPRSCLASNLCKKHHKRIGKSKVMVVFLSDNFSVKPVSTSAGFEKFLLGVEGGGLGTELGSSRVGSRVKRFYICETLFCP